MKKTEMKTYNEGSKERKKSTAYFSFFSPASLVAIP
jgi:hypothetical protein